MKDLYPTRISDKYSIKNRIDKVSYKKPELLNNEQFDFYNENGFLIVKNFFNKNKIRVAKNECYDLLVNNKEYYVNREPNSKKVRSILSVNDNKNISTLLGSQVINMVESILGDSVYLHQSRINYKD